MDVPFRPASSQNLSHIVSLIDHTYLTDRDPVGLEPFLKKMGSKPVASICIHRELIESAKIRGYKGRIATVANFPGGDEPQNIRAEIETALAFGSDEIDAVVPYREWLNGNRAPAYMMIANALDTAPHIPVKFILEAAAFGPKGDFKVDAFSDLCDEAGQAAFNRKRFSDSNRVFLKTGTGFFDTPDAMGAVTSALPIFLNTLKEHPYLGLKLSAGIKTPAQAMELMGTVRKHLGKEKARALLVPGRFRFGASSLLANCEGRAPAPDKSAKLHY